LKEVELQLITELMKNSRRSDRELGRAMNISQPTVTRIRRKLEREGVIKEYTMVPDFRKLGYNLMAIVFFKLARTLSTEELKALHDASRKIEQENPRAYLFVMNGFGLEKHVAMVAYFNDYSEYSEYIQNFKSAAQFHLKPFVYSDVTGFLMDLNDNTHYQPITFSKVVARLQKNALQKQILAVARTEVKHH
jgi:DNA-binding Lrp family transcriptional regulator